MEVMEMEMDYFSTSTTTITTTNTTASTTPLSMDEEWAEWGTVIDWDNCLEAPPTDFDELGELIDSFMNHHEDSPNPDLAMIGENMVTTPPMVEEEVEDDGKGVRLVHLLLAGAEALTGGHRSLDLAGVILVRLKELTSPSAGRPRRDSNMERLAAHFTDALLALLDGAGAKPAEAPPDSLEKIVAFQLFQDMSPYVKFGHFTANQAILEAVAGQRRVHILDYDIMEGVQWASLMQALQTARPHLRITAVTRPGGAGTADRRKSAAVVQETGRRLAAFAATIDLPFSFHHCRLDPGEGFRPSSVKLVKGESVVANCVLHFSHRPRSSVASFLSGAAALGAKVVVVVEEEAGAGARGGGFAGRFMDSLHQHSALSDSLVAGFPNQDRARRLVERAWLGPKIVGSVGMSYKGGEEGEVSWGDWLEGSGFGPVGLSYFNHRQAKLLVGLFNDGYSVEEVGAHKLVLGWKSRRLLTASAWSPPTAGSETGFTS